MANIVPGALWHPIDVGKRAARHKGRGLIGHVAVSNQTLLLPGPLASRPSDWTFYLPKEPYPTGERFAQLIDLDLQCWSSGAGNATCPAFESQGGMGTAAQVNAEPWTANQVESAAIILAHLHRTEAVPLQDMGNSLTSSRGMAVHRYGISPWRVAGGEVWSSSNGKLCPGDAKVRQIPAIVARAQQLVNGEDDMPLSQDDLNKISVVVKEWSAKSLASTPLIDWGNGKTATLPQQVADTMKAVAALQGQIAGLVEAMKGSAGGGVDLTAVKDAAEAGAQEALSRVQLTVAADDDA